MCSEDGCMRLVVRADEALHRCGVCGRVFCADHSARLSVVFPAPRANELLRAMEGARLAPKRMRLVESFAGKPPKLVLADAVKGGGSQMHWLPTLVLYEADGSPTLEYRKIYRM